MTLYPVEHTFNNKILCIFVINSDCYVIHIKLCYVYMILHNYYTD